MMSDDPYKAFGRHFRGVNLLSAPYGKTVVLLKWNKDAEEYQEEARMTQNTKDNEYGEGYTGLASHNSAFANVGRITGAFIRGNEIIICVSE
jgi:hypothetical protein